MKLIFLDEVDSTNNYARGLVMAENPEEGTVVLAQRQTGGRGQGKNVWESEPGENLTFSIIWYPHFLPASDQFQLSRVVSLGLLDFFRTQTDGVSVKWPNDLMIGRQKVAGILLEHAVMGNRLHSTIAGIGLNLNQAAFPAHLPHAVSLSQVTGRRYPLQETLHQVLACLFRRYDDLRKGRIAEIEGNYRKNLFRIDEWGWFKAEGETFEGRIAGTDEFGRLLLEKRNGQCATYSLKEVEMVL